MQEKIYNNMFLFIFIYFYIKIMTSGIIKLNNNNITCDVLKGSYIFFSIFKSY